MNAFESTLSDALRDRAEEITMATDLNRGHDVLESRLDGVDRTRRWRMAGGLAAAAAVVVAVAVAMSGGSTQSAPPADPSPGGADGSQVWASTPLSSSPTAFVRPLRFELPPLLAAGSFIGSEKPTWISIQQDLCDGSPANPCAVGRDVKLRVLAPVQIYAPGSPEAAPMPGYDEYVAFLESLAGPGTAITDRRETQVDGHPATVLTVVTAGSDTSAIGCDAAGLPIERCWGYAAGDVDPAHLRLAVIDQGATPVVMWLESNQDNPDRDQVDAQFDQVLSTVRFG